MMKQMKRWFSALLVLCLMVGLIPISVRAVAPKVALRDMQTHVWAQLQEMPELGGSYYYGTSSVTADEYFVDIYSNLVSYAPVHLMLYDNGELYISQEEVPGAEGFQKVMDNVREISAFRVPLLKATSYTSTSSNQYFVPAYYEDPEDIQLTVVVTEDDDLYLLGVPREYPEENQHLEHWTYHAKYVDRRDFQVHDSDYDFYHEYNVDMEFPFPYSDSSNIPVKIASGIEHIVPGYEYSLSFVRKDRDGDSIDTVNRGDSGFYIDALGNSYFGFPTLTDTIKLANENIIGYDNGLYLTENGVLHNIDGESIAYDVKDYSSEFYLTNEGLLYDMDGKRLMSGVKTLVEDASKGSSWYEFGEVVKVGVVCIKEDDSLWTVTYEGAPFKVMEDVAAVYGCRFAVRSNGDIYMLEESSDGDILPRKILSGSGIAPNPAPTLHAGKIFKDASSWALIDLRSARDSGLTIPVDGLSYNKSITRERFAEVAVRLYESLSGRKAPVATINPFTDTNNPEILKAYSLGIVKGISSTTFSPENLIDRESIAVMLKRAVDASGARLPSGSTKQFHDEEQISGWAKEAVTAMTTANVIKGTGADMFSPKGTTTVEQAVILSWRVLSSIK